MQLKWYFFFMQAYFFRKQDMQKRFDLLYFFKIDIEYATPCIW